MKTWPLDTHFEALEKFGVDLGIAQAAWPDVAYALRLARVRLAQDDGASDAPPSKIANHLAKVADLARNLHAQVKNLEELGSLAADAGHDHKAKALWNIERDIVAGSFGFYGSDYFSLRREERMEALAAATAFRITLMTLAENLDAASGKARALGNPGRAASMPYLAKLVPILAIAWTKMTGRPASAEPVVRKRGTSVSDFVRFVTWATSIAGLHPPTQDQVHAALPEKPDPTGQLFPG